MPPQLHSCLVPVHGSICPCCRRQHSGGGMEEWFLPGSRPDRLIHRTVRYVEAADGGQQEQEQQQEGMGGPFPSAHAAAPAGAAVGAAGAAGGAGAAGRASMARHRSHNHRSSVAASWEPEERAVASIRQRYSSPQGCNPGSSAGAVAAAVVERVFDLAAGQLRLVVADAAALAAGEDGAENEPGRVTRCYGGLGWEELVSQG